MKVAVISDIHANLEALQACLKKIDELKPGKVICLGDLVDYCAQPNECIELIKQYSDINIMGNHDEAQIDHPLADGFSEHAYISSVHTRSVMKKEYLGYFKTLPYIHSYNNMFFVHASPFAPEDYNYVLSPDFAAYNFKHFKEKICFIGHSHIPVIFEERKNTIGFSGPEFLKPENRYIINVGSVGQPRDRDYRACFGLFDTDEFKFEYVRLDYPAEAASEKIIKEGLPRFLAERILIGI